MTENEGYDDQWLGVILIAINSLAMVIALLSVCTRPIMKLVNISVSKHIHDSKIKGLIGDETKEELKIYFEELIDSTVEDAGWLELDWDDVEFEERVGAILEVRNAEGHGAINQIRVTATYKCAFDDLKMFIRNDEGVTDATTVESNKLKVFSKGHEITYTAKRLAPLFSVRDFVFDCFYHDDGGADFFTVARSIDTPLFPKHNSRMLHRLRAELKIGGFHVRQLDLHRCTVTYLADVDLKGLLGSDYLRRYLAKTSMRSQVEGIYGL